MGVRFPLRALVKNVKKIVLGMLIGLLALIGIIVVYFSFDQGGAMLKQYVSTKTAKTKVTTAFFEADKKADEQNTTQKRILTEAGLAGEQVVQSKVDVCYVTHRDSGWFAKNWYQRCYIRYVTGFVAHTTSTEFARTISQSGALRSEFGEAHPTASPCVRVEKEYRPTLMYRPANVMQDAVFCDMPDSTQGLFSVYGPITPNDELATTVYKTFDPAQIDPSQNIIWSTADIEYYSEDLGCGVGIILCSNPREEAVTAH